MLEGKRSSPPLHPEDIGVMAPWRGQVWKIRERLRKVGLSAVDVGTVEVCFSVSCCQLKTNLEGYGNLGIGLPR